jgi:nucleoid DNA-binding protein
MVRSGLVSALSVEYSSWPSADVALAVQVLLDTVKEALAEEDRIEIRKFGTLRCKALDARDAHNPKNGQRVRTARKMRPRFRAAKYLRQRVDSNHKVKKIVVTSRRERRRILETDVVGAEA